MTTNPPISTLSKEDLAPMLRRKILDYKRIRPNLSSQQIAKKFGMSSSTFNRIENLDIKTPTFDQVIKVLTGTGHHEDLLSYLEENYPAIASIYEKGLHKASNSKYVKESVSDYLVDPRTSKLMLISFSKSGLKRSLIESEFGKDGLRILKFLVDKKILYHDGNNIFRVRDSGVKIDQKATRSLVNRALNDFYDLNGFEEKTSYNYLTFQSESINLEKVYPIIIGLLAELQQNVREIFNNPDNHGEDTVFVSTISDSLIKNNLGEQFLKGVLK